MKRIEVIEIVSPIAWLALWRNLVIAPKAFPSARAYGLLWEDEFPLLLMVDEELDGITLLPLVFIDTFEADALLAEVLPLDVELVAFEILGRFKLVMFGLMMLLVVGITQYWPNWTKGSEQLQDPMHILFRETL